MTQKGAHKASFVLTVHLPLFVVIADIYDIHDIVDLFDLFNMFASFFILSADPSGWSAC